jgi:hypothetical protein
VRIARLSVPGHYCRCGKMTKALVCPGCQWVDPLTTAAPPDTQEDESG